MFDDIDINKLFDNNIDDIDKYKFTKITKKIIERAENILGHKLPKSYIELMKLQNGGCFNSSLPNYENFDGCIYGISKDENNKGSIENLNKYWKDNLYSTETGIIFGEDGSGEQVYCFDYQNSDNDDEPIITIIDINARKHVIANNFSEFIHNYYNGKKLMYENIEEYSKKSKKEDASDTEFFRDSCGCVVFSFLVAIIAFIAGIDFLFNIGAFLIVISCLIFLFSLFKVISNSINKKKNKK